MNPILIDLLFIFVAALLVIRGYQKGFLFSIFGLLAFLAALAIAYLTYPPISQFLFLNSSRLPLSFLNLNYLTANLIAFSLLFIPLFFVLRKVAERLTQHIFASFFYFLINHRKLDRIFGSLLTFFVGIVVVSSITLLSLNLPFNFNRAPIYASYWGRSVLPYFYGVDTGINVSLGRSSQTNVLSYLVPQNESFSDASRVFSKLNGANTAKSASAAQNTKTATNQETDFSKDSWDYNQPVSFSTPSGGQTPKTIDQILGYRQFNAEEEKRKTFELVNKARAEKGLPLMVADPALDRLAMNHALEMKRTDYISHFDSRGKDNEDRAREAGLTFFQERENISLAPNAETAQRSEMSSPGHRHTILKPQMIKLGIAVVPGVRGNNLYVKEFIALEAFDTGPESD